MKKMNIRLSAWILSLSLLLSFSLTACTGGNSKQSSTTAVDYTQNYTQNTKSTTSSTRNTTTATSTITSSSATNSSKATSTTVTTIGTTEAITTAKTTQASTTTKITVISPVKTKSFRLEDVPDYSGTPYVIINDNTPYFTEDEITDESYEYYSPLDSLGRCGVAMASLGEDLMPTEKREEIGKVKPSGWHSVQYDCVEGKSLYNRSHLIGFQLAGENANECNLITGTRYFNATGMLPFENMVADYIKETGNHVMYRVTPIFVGDELVARGTLMEAYSVEDDGDGILFNVYCYNVQPGIAIDYATGESSQDGKTATTTVKQTTMTTTTKQKQTTAIKPQQTTSAKPKQTTTTVTQDETHTHYILNTRTHKFHIPGGCKYVDEISDKNREDYYGSMENLIKQGYKFCGFCSKNN